METSGELSIYFYEDEDVKPGLPIQPEYYSQTVQIPTSIGVYSCASCGMTLELVSATKKICPECSHHKWIKSISGRRVS